MFLIIYKNGLNTDKSKIIFDQPLTFQNANQMLMDAVNKYKQSGLNMKVTYKIIDKDTGENMFNSKLAIDSDIKSLFHVIKGNKNTPKTVIDFITKVEQRLVIEDDSVVSDSHSEEKARLEQLKAEKNNIQNQLKKEEKESQQRELEYEKQMKQIQGEKKRIEMSLQVKEKEESVKEIQRIEALNRLEEEKRIANNLMEEKRALDKKRAEEHNKRLEEVESETKIAEIELAQIEAEIEKNALERKQEIKALEAKKVEMTRKVNILRAENENEEVKHQKYITSQCQNKLPTPRNEEYYTEVLIPELTLKEKLQEIDFKTLKAYANQIIIGGIKSSLKAIRNAYILFKVYRENRMIQQQEKQKLKDRQIEIDEKLAHEKIKFIEEIRKEQEKEIRKAVKMKESQARIEARYVKELNKNKKHFPIFRYSFRTFVTLGLLVAAVGSIYYFDLGNSHPIVNDIKAYVDSFVIQKFYQAR